MGSLEKTVKVATCCNRSSLHLSSSWLWPRPRLRLAKVCPSSSSSPIPPTTWLSSGEPPSSKPSLPVLSRDSEVLEVTATVPEPELRRAEMGGLMTEMMDEGRRHSHPLHPCQQWQY